MILLKQIKYVNDLYFKKLFKKNTQKSISFEKS